jgi:hypothetical protein
LTQKLDQRAQDAIEVATLFMD